MDGLYDAFVTLLVGCYYQTVADDVSTPQCFDVAQGWSKLLGGQRFTGATADLIYYQPQNGFYQQISNGPTNYPVKGDIVVFNWPHVGVCTGNNTDENQLELVEQNDPAGTAVQIKVYPNYDGVIGWLHCTKY